MNNDGGGIFSYLPQSTEETYFEKLFGTPTGLTFDSIATMYEAEYFAVESKEDLTKALTTPKQKDITNYRSEDESPTESVSTHRQLWNGYH